eukprot:7620867-Pyramimonas_sp.AAC.1
MIAEVGGAMGAHIRASPVGGFAGHARPFDQILRAARRRWSLPTSLHPSDGISSSTSLPAAGQCNRAWTATWPQRRTARVARRCGNSLARNGRMGNALRAAPRALI